MNRATAKIALVTAAAALAFLGWRAWLPRERAAPTVTQLALWTAGATTSVAPVAAAQRALPDASAAPATIARVPDVAFLRRAFPALETITVLGDGVSAAEAAALDGIAVSWTPPPLAGSGPEFIALSASRTLRVGDRFEVQGSVRGLGPQPTPLILEAPDGAAQSVELRGDASGAASFRMVSAPANAAGRTEWLLRLGAGPRLTLGADVQAARLPRVLILESSPNAETARLHRWLEAHDGAVTSRVRVSADHFRTGSAHGAPPEIPRLDTAALHAFDIVVAGEAAVAALETEEQNALAAAVRTRGLGLLLLGETAHAPALPDWLSGWRLAPIATASPIDELRSTRLRLADGTTLMEARHVLPAELPALPLARALVRDVQDHAICAVAPVGRGHVARSLIVDAWRWLQTGQPDQYAALWSEILSAVALPHGETSWRIENGSGVLCAGDAVELSFSVGAERASAGPVLQRSGGAEPMPLALVRDPMEPTRWRTIAWPAAEGWHEVRATNGATISFHVQPRAALPGIERARRHAATQRAVLASATIGSKRGDTALPRTPARAWLPDLLAWLIFVGSAGVLFRDDRRG